MKYKLLIGLLLLVSLTACKPVGNAVEKNSALQPPATENKTTISTPTNYTGSILVNGLQRTYLVHIPQSYDKNRKWPLVIALHGGGSEGKYMNALTGFNSLADNKGFIVVYPDAIGHNWNDGRGDKNIKSQADNIDDVFFISELIEYLKTDLNLDAARVYATGISNGAMMCHRLGCELSGKIAAIAAVAGNIPQKMVSIWSPARPVPVLLINGTEDPLVPYEGGEVTFMALKRGRVVSVAETAKFWTSVNGCSAAAVTSSLPHLDPGDSTSTIVEKYPGCRDGSEVILYTVKGGGHTWPGGLQYMSEVFVGKTSRDFSATDTIWEFFSRHPLK